MVDVLDEDEIVKNDTTLFVNLVEHHKVIIDRKKANKTQSATAELPVSSRFKVSCRLENAVNVVIPVTTTQLLNPLNKQHRLTPGTLTSVRTVCAAAQILLEHVKQTSAFVRETIAQVRIVSNT